MLQPLHVACALEEMAQTSRARLRLWCDVVAVERGPAPPDPAYQVGEQLLDGVHDLMESSGGKERASPT